MRKIVKYEALDGKLFDNEEACATYEVNHPFLNPEEIQFYSLRGKQIKNPCESVFLDSNRFVVYTSDALKTYQEYCERFRIKAPEDTHLPCAYPRHYIFAGNEWMCIEEQILELECDLKTFFLNEYEDNEEERHNLVTDCG